MSDQRNFTEELGRTARDAAYVAVGFGVLGFQRAQVRRRELVKRLGVAAGLLQQQAERFGGDLSGAGAALQQQLERLGDLPADLSGALLELDEAVETVITRLEALVEPLEEHLPAPARDAVKQARVQARSTQQQLRRRFRPPAA